MLHTSLKAPFNGMFQSSLSVRLPSEMLRKSLLQNNKSGLELPTLKVLIVFLLYEIHS